jgi:hypothetical protein
MSYGKEKCNMLKAIRKLIADKNGIDYTPTECTYQGDCYSMCEQCEKETAELYAALRKKQEEGAIIEFDINLPEQCDLLDKNFPFKPKHAICGELSGREDILTGMVDSEQWD